MYCENERRKVLILANNDMGLYKFRKELIETLLKEYRVIISLPEGPFVENLKQMGCEFIETKFERRGKNPFDELKLLLFYKKIFSDIRPDIVLTYTIKPTIYGGIACRISKIPYIINITGLGTAVENPGILQKMILLMYRTVLPHAQCVFFQNRSNMDFFVKRGMTKKTILIPGSGVNVTDFRFEEYPDLNDCEDKFLFIGRIMKDKGVEELFEAAARIKEKYPKVSFDIIGGSDEDYSEKMEELSKKEIITYWNVQSDVRPFLKQCGAVVLPSYHEGMANVLLEASALGRPVLASKVPGCRETFDEGITGIGFAVRNADALYEALENFILLGYTEKVEMGKAARRKMEKEFDRQKVIEAYLKEIKSIIKQ